VECAIDLQRKMAAAGAADPEHRKIVLRVGVNLGDVICGESPPSFWGERSSSQIWRDDALLGAEPTQTRAASVCAGLGTNGRPPRSRVDGRGRRR
jgi:hypothetical protein